MCFFFDGVVWAGLAMIWAWPVCVASVLLELVFKKLEPMEMNSDIDARIKKLILTGLK